MPKNPQFSKKQIYFNDIYIYIYISMKYISYHESWMYIVHIKQHVYARGLAWNFVAESLSFARVAEEQRGKRNEGEMRDALLMAVISNALRRLLSRFMPSLRIPAHTQAGRPTTWLPSRFQRVIRRSRNAYVYTLGRPTRTTSRCLIFPLRHCFVSLMPGDNHRWFVIFRRLLECFNNAWSDIADVVLYV